MSDDLLARLLVSFKSEQRDHIDKVRAILDGLARSEVSGPAALEEAFRRAHSLKGAARAVDLHPVEALAHAVETIFSRVRDERLPLDARTFRIVHLVFDTIEDWVAAYFAQKPSLDPSEVLETVKRLLETSEGGTPEPGPGPTTPALSTPLPAGGEALSVNARSMEQLMIASESVSAEISRQDALTSRLHALEARVLDLDREHERLRRARRRGFGRLLQDRRLAPIGRFLDSTEGGVRSLRKDLRELRTNWTRDLWRLSNAGGRLKEEVLQARLVPADSVFQGLRKMVRDLARDQNKPIELSAEGLAIEADRLVLQALKDPLMHILRNAVSHGFAAPSDRPGVLALRLHTDGNQLSLSVSDNGGGVDWGRVADQAVKRRLLTAAAAGAASPGELSRLLFLPGFSTSRMVTDLSGRGMGLSVVAETVKRLQGSVTLRSEGGEGTRIEIVVPISLSSHKLLLLECAGQRYALPTLAVERLCRVPLAAVETVAGRSVIVVDKRPVPLSNLARLLGQGDVSLTVENEALPVAVLRSPAGAVAVAADRFVSVTESVVKSIRGGAEKMRAFASAIQGADGALVLVLDSNELIARCQTTEGAAAVRTEPAAPPRRVPTMLVVDDSITTRTLEKSILEAHGYQVMLAVDGEEALQRLRADPPDLAIVDIQMPRMDGFTLIEHMKRDTELAKIPVIIVSSLESRAEKERGLALGAEAYIVKGKFDHKGLLEAIRQIL